MPIVTPTLNTERLRLRPFEPRDKDAIYALQSNARVLKYWDAPPWNELSAADRFLESSKSIAEDDRGIRLVLERLSDGAFVGWCTIGGWNSTFRSATLGYCLMEAAWGQGYATEASNAVLGWAFETLNLNRVQGEADTRNHGSWMVMEKLGFTREGTLRQDCIVNGDISDTHVYGLLRAEWEEQNPSGARK